MWRDDRVLIDIKDAEEKHIQTERQEKSPQNIVTLIVQSDNLEFNERAQNDQKDKSKLLKMPLLVFSILLMH
jgi:hypothetical protein